MSEPASKSNPNHIQIENSNGLTRSPKQRNNQFTGIRLTHNPLDPLDEKVRRLIKVSDYYFFIFVCINSYCYYY
jgi:hypothetical protein